MILSRRSFLGTGLAIVAGMTILPAVVSAASRIFRRSGLAIRGYDPVAYFTISKPTKGKKQFSTKWQGSTWVFASQENLDTFKNNPAKYAPVYGGYCSWAMSEGRIATTVPEAWDIVDGKLYLNYSLGIRSKWRTNIPKFIKRANKHWSKVSKTLS